MEPEEFLSRSEFEALSEAEQVAYAARVMATLAPILDLHEVVDAGQLLPYTVHYFDLMEWLLPPEEYERLVRSRMWDAMWQNADLIVEVLEAASESPNLTDEERSDAASRLDAARAVLAHKRGLTELGEADP